MDKERMAELEKIEAHDAENGWVAPMTEEDREFFAYFRSVFKRYNISPSKATRLEYDFVTQSRRVNFISRRQVREGILCLLRCKFCAACPCIKDLLNLSSRGTMRQTGATKHPSAALRQTMKNRFLSPVTRVFRKRFLTTCLTTDSRGVCGNSGGKSCEDRQ